MGNLAQYLPIIGWLPGYRTQWLKEDLIAGLTITALVIPEGIAYAGLAGMPPESVFYTTVPALLFFALFSTSHHLSVGPSSAVAVISAATVGSVIARDSEQFTAATSALAILTGGVLICAGLLRLGRIAQFFSESVLTGFVFGLAMVIAVKQLPKVFGIEAGEGDFFQRLWDLIIHLDHTIPWAVGVGIGTIVVMVLLERYVHRVPAALAALILGILVSHLFTLEDRGVPVVGEFPGGMSLPALPDLPLKDWVNLAAGAVGVALVMFAEAIGPDRKLAARSGYQISINQELIALGAASASSGVFRGFASGASLSKSAAAAAAGQKTQIAGLFAAVFTLGVAFFLTPVFFALPEASLGAIVVVAVAGMMNVTEMRRLARLRRSDFMLASVALLAVLIFETLPALITAVLLSLFTLIWRVSQPHLSELGRRDLAFHAVDVSKTRIIIPGLVVLRPDEEIFFANAESLRQKIIGIAHQSTDPPTRAVVLDLEMSTELDVPSLDMLRELVEWFQQHEVTLMLSRVHAGVRASLRTTGILTTLGEENIYPRSLEATIAYLQHSELKDELSAVKAQVKREYNL